MLVTALGDDGRLDPHATIAERRCATLRPPEGAGAATDVGLVDWVWRLVCGPGTAGGANRGPMRMFY